MLELVKKIEEIAGASDVVEPEIQTDAFLFLADYYYRQEDRGKAASFAKRGFDFATLTGNCRAQKQFAVRCLLITEPGVELSKLRVPFNGVAPLEQEVERLLFPLMTKSGCLFKTPGNGVSRVIERLRIGKMAG